LARVQSLPTRRSSDLYRIVSLDSLVLLFGLMFLLAGRIPIDTKTGMKSLLMSSALRKWQYVLGKLLGGFLYVFSMQCIFLVLNRSEEHTSELQSRFDL